MSHEVKVTGRKLTFSEAIRKLNPEVFANGGVRPAQPKSESGGALERKTQTPGTSKRRVARGNAPVLRVHLIRIGARMLDDDNLISGYKPLRDAIASRFGLDDNQRTIEWRYGQCQGDQGTIVMMELI